MDALTGIKIFRQVVESGSFVAAAERMEVSTAMVSKHVIHLEKRLGVRLLNRNSRTLSLTEAGRVYYERCKTILDDLEQTELELGSLNDAPRGTLRITAPSWFAGQQAFAECLADYCRRYPEIVLDLSLEDRFVDLVEEGYDLALRITGRLGSKAAGPQDFPVGLIARRRALVPLADNSLAHLSRAKWYAGFPRGFRAPPLGDHRRLRHLAADGT